MHFAKTDGNRKFRGLKYAVWGLLFLLLIGFFAVASATDLGTFSGRVWNDTNNDGLMDASEPGVAGVVLHLQRQDTGEVLTAISDEAGQYLFTDLVNDSYEFSVEVPDGMLLARYRREGELRSILTGDDNDFSRSFIVRTTRHWSDMNLGLVDSAIIKGIAYLDVNYNGNYDEGEPPYPDVTLEVIRNGSDRSVEKLVTGADGSFYFNFIRTGEYRLRTVLPDDGSTFTLVPASIGYFSNRFEARPGRRENSVDPIDAENSMVYEFYVGVAFGGSVSGTVFSDKDYSGAKNRSEKGLSGIPVQLVNTNGEVTAETRTGRDGEYTISDVMPGEYTLRFERKSDYTFTKYRPLEADGNDAVLNQTGAYGETVAFTVGMRDVLTGYDAGMVQSATLGGVFFYDENDNGLMDKDEAGFTDGQVRLLSTDGEIDITQNVEADGSYYFSGVAPTDYTLYYLLPEHAEMAKVANKGNTLAHQGLENAVTGLSLKARKNYTQPLVGAVKLGTFTGTAFTDLNADGLQGDGEAALAGVRVSIAPAASPNDAISATSGTDGAYAITGLRPGEYVLSIALPDGLIFSSEILSSGILLGTTDAYMAPILFSTLLRRTENMIGAVPPATLQASVWLDENQNGVQDTGERLLSGLNYALYDETRQKEIAIAPSDENGYATFHNVRPSAYSVSFALPAGATPVAGAGTFTEVDGIMRQSGIAVHAGDTYNDIEGGLVCVTSIGGIVHADELDGRQPVADAEVHLYLQGDSQLLQSTVTNAQGMYRFDGLWPGEYVIEVVRPSGYVFVRPNDQSLQAGDSVIAQISDEYATSAPFPLYMAQDITDRNVLLTLPAKVGSIVWLDENENGLIDGNEPMINGVTITLNQDGAAVYVTTSNEWGYYEFDAVYPGEYTLRAVAYPALNITTPIPALQIISSCLTLGDGTIATSEPFSVTSGSTNFFYHLGYILKPGAKMPPEISEGASQVWPQPE